LTEVSHAPLYWSYRGEMVMTLCPRFASSTGKLPTTSPSPPVFDQGAHSVLTNTIFMGFVVFALYGASDAARVWGGKKKKGRR